MSAENKINALIEIVTQLICEMDGINPKDAQYLLEQLYELKENT